MSVRSFNCYVIAGAILCSNGLAYAQSTGAVNAETDAKGDRLQEIVVTAQKRTQRSQDVPIAISTVSADTADKLAVKGTEDLANAVPGLIFNRSSFSAAPSIRGIGSIVIAHGDESTVGIYIDGVLQVAPTVGVFSLNNIDHIEVLKGPQGTLFGRNSIGGVINVITKTPSTTPSADVSVGYASYNTWDGSFY
jgi:iron complex outermembrane receptor protein